MAMLVTLCWGLQSVVDPGLSLQPHIYNIITQTTKWEVVKNRASPKRPFFLFLFFIFLVIFPVSEHFRSKANFLDTQKGGYVPEMSPPP